MVGAHGSVRFDKRRRTWNYLWYEAGKRRSKLIGNKQQYPTKAAAWKSVESITKQPHNISRTLTVQTLVEQYRQEKMPKRASTRRGYETYLRKHILPKWQDADITELQPRVVELWFRSLGLAPKSKVHVRGLLHTLWDYAMWRGDVPTQRNPMELVEVQECIQAAAETSHHDYRGISPAVGDSHRAVSHDGHCRCMPGAAMVRNRWAKVAGHKLDERRTEASTRCR